MIQVYRRPSDSKLWQAREIVFVVKFFGFRQCCWLLFELVDILSAWDFAEILLDPSFCLCRIEITGDGQYDVVWDIPAIEEVFHILQGGSLQVFKRADHLPAVWVSGRIQVLVDHI